MGGITNRYWTGLAAIRSIQAGADILLLPTNAVVAIREVERAVKRGDISEGRINESVKKILHAKSRLGLQYRRTVAINRINEVVSSPQNMQLAQDIANHSITAVKDEQRLLPLNPAGDLKLFSLVLASDLESSPGSVFQAEMRQRFPSIRTAWANARVPNEVLADLEKSVSQSDLIVCSTLIRLSSGQQTAAIPESQRAIFQKLLLSRKPLIWIAMGDPYVLRSAPEVGTYICTFSYSDVSQIAAAKALAGEIAIDGKMPVSIPGYVRAGEGLQIPKLDMTLKRATFKALSQSPNAFEKTKQLMASSIEAGVFPGAAILVGHKGAVTLEFATGKTGFSADSPGVTLDTVYELSSLSSVAVVSAAMLASESGGLILSAPVQDYIPEFKGKDSDKLRIQDLLALLSGRFETEESNSSRDLLEEITSRASGIPFHRFLARHLFEPLGMTSTFWSPPKAFRGYIARVSAEGNTSLFSSIHDLAVFAQMLLNRGVYGHRRYFKPETIAKFTGPQGPWSKPSDADWTGQLLPPTAYGYSSCNGPFLWVDPARQLFIVFMANSALKDAKIGEIQGKICESALFELTIDD
jgi:CubicO group peptidase (beta-lactamase class C family)